MEELLTEQKAKAYDKAKSIMKKYIESGNAGVIAENTIKKAFPELAESEDERIRKDLIIYLRSVLSNKKYGDKFIEDWIAWLEKLPIEKLPFEMKTPEESLGIDSDTYSKIVDECIYGDDEQKPDDKVEPKFNVGDWITNGIDFTFQVCSIKDNMYLRSDDYFIDIETAGKTFRHWTIQDAKGGDVLYCESDGIEYIVMSKGINEHGNIDSYFRYNSLDGFGADIPSVLSVSQDNITPATKKQRNFLFQKMKEAGYEWSDKDRKLIKIVK